MSNTRHIPIFLSSPHYGLEDLRGELASYLEELGTQPFVSSDTGFPDYPNMPPYAQCIRALESCLMVVGVVDRRYGQRFDDWGPYRQYAGLSPTHAELRHALISKKRTLIYIRSEIHGYYDIYRKNKEAFKNLDLPPGLEVSSLEMFAEVKQWRPAPWIESFRDVRDIKESIRKRLLHDLYQALVMNEKLSMAGADLVLERILRIDPELLDRILYMLTEMPPEKAKDLHSFLEELVGSEAIQRATEHVTSSLPLPLRSQRARELSLWRMAALAA